MIQHHLSFISKSLANHHSIRYVILMLRDASTDRIKGFIPPKMSQLKYNKVSTNMSVFSVPEMPMTDATPTRGLI